MFLDQKRNDFSVKYVHHRFQTSEGENPVADEFIGMHDWAKNVLTYPIMKQAAGLTVSIACGFLSRKKIFLFGKKNIDSSE